MFESGTRGGGENSFGHLKGCWRCLMKHNDVDICIMSDIIAACCILHTVCELNKEKLQSEWGVEHQLAAKADQHTMKG